jgi:hypothetical protein
LGLGNVDGPGVIAPGEYLHRMQQLTRLHLVRRLCRGNIVGLASHLNESSQNRSQDSGGNQPSNEPKYCAG